MSPVTDFIIFCRLEDGNLTDSRLCRRFPILIPFARRFKNRRLFNLPIGTGLSDLSSDRNSKEQISYVYYECQLGWWIDSIYIGIDKCDCMVFY